MKLYTFIFMNKQDEAIQSDNKLSFIRVFFFIITTSHTALWKHQDKEQLRPAQFSLE